VHIRQPVQRSRRPDARVIDCAAVAGSLDIGPILIDPLAQLRGITDRSVARDNDVDLVSHRVEQAQGGELVVDRFSGIQIEKRHQDVREHVSRHENAALLDQ